MDALSNAADAALVLLGPREGSTEMKYISSEMRIAAPELNPWALPDTRLTRVGPADVADIVRADSSRICLIGNRACPFAHRAWFTLHEVNAQGAVEVLHVDLGPSKPSFYAAELNPPYGSTPVLWDCGSQIPDSLIVMRYLVDKYAPDSGLFGRNAAEKAQVALVLAKFNPVLLYRFLMARDPAAMRDARVQADELIHSLESFYEEAEGPYLLGDKFSAAELAVAPFLVRMIPALRYYKAHELLTPAAHPQLLAMLKAVEARHAFRITSNEQDFSVDAYRKFARGELAGPVADNAFVGFTKKRPLIALLGAVAVGASVAVRVARRGK